MYVSHSAEALEARRRDAVAAVNAGRPVKEVSATLGVHPHTVYRWVRQDQTLGAAGLAARPSTGRKPLLTADQASELLTLLDKPPEAYGLPHYDWTSRAVAALVRRRYGVEFKCKYLRAWLIERRFIPRRQDPAKPWLEELLAAHRAGKTAGSEAQG
jgi:transposase